MRKVYIVQCDKHNWDSATIDVYADLGDITEEGGMTALSYAGECLAEEAESIGETPDIITKGKGLPDSSILLHGRVEDNLGQWFEVAVYERSVVHAVPQPA